MKIIFIIYIYIAAVLPAFASARIYSEHSQGLGIAKPAQAFALSFAKKTLLPIPGSESYIRDTAGQASGLSRNNKAQADTSSLTKIIGVREGGDTFRLLLDLGEDQHNLSINAYNLLGKRVSEIYQGVEKAGRGKDYQFNVSSLPNGVYICVVQGDNFRLAEKFVISR